jgi:MFS family permease
MTTADLLQVEQPGAGEAFPPATDGSVAAHPVSRAYRRYVMWVLLAICTLNFLDRQIVNILAEPIKHEFGLKDRQIGMLTGFYFAVFYSVLSIPLARLADRGNRSWLITAALGLWSLFTVASGFARAYLQLAVLRLLVGVGEAGGSPTAQSLITDYHPRGERARAIAFYTIGIPIGSLLGLAMGGLVLDRFGWRTAFVIAGAPGLLLAVLTGLTLKEPRKHAALAVAPAPSLSEAFRELASKRSFILLTIGGCLVTFVNYGQGAFLPSFFFRNHASGLAAIAASWSHATGVHFGPAGVLGLCLGVCSGIGGIAGTLFGGWLTDKMAARDLTAYVTLQVWFTLARIPLVAIAFTVGQPLVAIVFVSLAAACMGVAGAPGYAAIQGLVRPRVRATAVAIFLLGLNLLGLGLGPLCVGLMSDGFAHAAGSGPGLRLSLLAAQLALVAAAGVMYAAKPFFVAETVS